MPTLEQVLNALSTLTNQWDLLAKAWYLYCAILCLALLIGIRPTKRIMAILLVIPLLPVSALAWRASDPFNAILTGLSAIVLFSIAIRLPRERIHIEPSWRVSMLITALSLMMDGLKSRPWSLVLGAIGLFYGIFGLVRLGISMDLFLVVGALLSILELYLPSAGTPRNGLATRST